MPAAVHDLVPIVHVADVGRSAAFYALLGFTTVSSRWTEGVVDWVWMKSGEACLMAARAPAPMDPVRQGVLLYLYTEDIGELRGTLVASGVFAGEVSYPDHMPNGEIEVVDPDGYRLLIGQLPPWRGRRF